MLREQFAMRIIPVAIVFSVADAHGNVPTGSFASSEARLATLECRRDKGLDVLNDTILQV